MEKDVLPSVTDDPSKKSNKKIMFRKAPNSNLGNSAVFCMCKYLKQYNFE